MPPSTPKKLYAASAPSFALCGASEGTLRLHGRSVLADAEMRHKVVLVAPGCGGFRRRGPRPPHRLQPPCPGGRHISRGRAQSTPLRLRLRSQPARFVWRAFLPPAPARLRCSRPPWRSSLCRSRPSQPTLLSPRRSVRCSVTRCALVAAYGPSLNASGRPVARA